MESALLTYAHAELQLLHTERVGAAVTIYTNGLQPGVREDILRKITIRPRIEVLACQKQAQYSH
jgi:hypothetical protein